MTGYFRRQMPLHEMLSSGQQRREWIRRMNALLPPGRNRWFHAQANALRAAQRMAQRLQSRFGVPIRVQNHVYPKLGLRHYHLSAPDGRHFRIRFFYGVDTSPAWKQGALNETSKLARARKIADGRGVPNLAVSRTRPDGYRRPAGVAKPLTQAEKAGEAKARNAFRSKRKAYKAPLRVKKKEDIHHAIELQALTRYPGVFTANELNALHNMRGIPREDRGKRKQLHNSAIRDRWNYHYRLLDAQIVALGLKPGTATYNEHVRRYLNLARREIDWSFGPFFTENLQSRRPRA